MGDGINDASALHAADVGISVESAVDVAKEAADIVLLEKVDHPRCWDIKAIRKFMITFGLVSSVFDYLTFGALLLIFHAIQDQFRTGWFLEFVISASLIVLVIRSWKPFFKSRPSKFLLI